REAAMIEQGAQRYGWPAMTRALRSAAHEPYLKGNLETAEAWRHAACWAEAWAETTDAFTARWQAARRTEAEGGDPFAATKTSEAEASSAEPAEARRMADLFSPELRIWALGNAEFSAGYFGTEQAADFRPESFAILNRLHARDAAVFAEFSALATAIALVHDTPPPREWPHWQVTTEALPRRLPAPEDTFGFFVELEKSGRGLQPLRKLDPAELRFLVDLVAPMDELRWAQTRIKTPLAKLDETYSLINYRMDRISAGAYVWLGKSYALDEILSEGGICVDQAYFATQAGKARGVPTLLFGGAGRDGRHAWFGYLGSGGKWQMDAGRYEEQKFVTGVAIDPQTWGEITDHELAFLSEGFRRERNFREAAVHAGFARWLADDGRAKEAELAARAAVRLERREIGGWEVLLALRPTAGTEREAVAREAAAGLSSYPELQARFLDEAITSLRTRGEHEEADRLGREMARRFAKKRGDLSVAQIAQQLARASETQTPEEQMRLYRSVLRRFGRGEGAAWWDEVVRPFVARLALAGRFTDARAALGFARETLGGTTGSQLATEMRELDAALAAAERTAAGAGAGGKK
ncbi:MAG: hypothetical protein H7067_20390, partial [Burkholderiales bacterium]|nr:hypothetical protein [Opitutaceae bacterium]